MAAAKSAPASMKRASRDRRHRDRRSGPPTSARRRSGRSAPAAVAYPRARRSRRPRCSPGELAVGERDQERVGALVVEPEGNFLVDPGRRGRFRRGEQDQIARVAERPPSCRLRCSRFGDAISCGSLYSQQQISTIISGNNCPVLFAYVALSDSAPWLDLAPGAKAHL